MTMDNNIIRKKQMLEREIASLNVMLKQAGKKEQYALVEK